MVLFLMGGRCIGVAVKPLISCNLHYLLVIFPNIGGFKRGDEAKVHISKSL